MTDADKLDTIRALLNDRKWIAVDTLINILDQREES